MNAVIGDAILGKIIGADFLTAVTSADERFAGLGGIFLLLFLLLFKETGAEDIHSLDAILLLGAFVLHGDDDAGREMGDADGRVGSVDSLATMPARTIDIDA